jgi:hypothetical protein
MTSTYQRKDVKAKPNKTHVDQKLGLKREVYSERTECPSSTLHDRASWSFRPAIAGSHRSVDEATDKAKRSIPELEIAGSGDVRDSSR